MSCAQAIGEHLLGWFSRKDHKREPSLEAQVCAAFAKVNLPARGIGILALSYG